MTDYRPYLREINTATKYPSIPTYHTIDQGLLREDEHVEYPEGATLIGTEKVDGTNSRIIFLPNGEYLIGSREELLYHQGDWVSNPSQGIVNAIRGIADALNKKVVYRTDHDPIRVIYGEVYGGKIGGQWKNYTTDPNQTGFRVFDIAHFDRDQFLGLSIEAISGMRERNELQRWYTETQLQQAATMVGIELTPRVFTATGTEPLPTTLEGVQEMLRSMLPGTQVALGGNAQNNAEGLVVRTEDRKVISKLRFEDYRKTLRKLSGAKR